MVAATAAGAIPSSVDADAVPVVRADKNTAKFLLCRQDTENPGYGLPEYDRDYSKGEPVYSELTQEGADDEMSEHIKNLDFAEKIIGTGSTIAGNIKGRESVAAGLAAVQGIHQCVSFGLSKSHKANDPTQELIKQEFERTNTKISALSDQVSAGFQQIRTDLADIELDAVMEQSIQSMQYAYKELQQAVQDADTSVSLKRLYADRYRATCHVPHYKPEDIFRNLYGYACGDKGVDRDCKAENGGENHVSVMGDITSIYHSSHVFAPLNLPT